MQTGTDKSLTPLLKELKQICDTGYALALHIRFTRPNILFQTYNQDWIDLYSANGMMLQDPVVQWGFANTGFVYWNDLDDPDGILLRASQYGITNGLTCAVDIDNSRSISGFSRSSGPFTAEEADYLFELTKKIHLLTQAEKAA